MCYDVCNCYKFVIFFWPLYKDLCTVNDACGFRIIFVKCLGPDSVQSIPGQPNNHLFPHKPCKDWSPKCKYFRCRGSTLPKSVNNKPKRSLIKTSKNCSWTANLVLSVCEQKVNTTRKSCQKLSAHKPVKNIKSLLFKFCADTDGVGSV